MKKWQITLKYYDNIKVYTDKSRTGNGRVGFAFAVRKANNATYNRVRENSLYRRDNDNIVCFT